MEFTILNQAAPNHGEIEQIVNATIGLAMEQGVSPETEVDVDHPMTLGTVELSGLSAETHKEVDMTHTAKPNDPSP